MEQARNVLDTGRCMRGRIDCWIQNVPLESQHTAARFAFGNQDQRMMIRDESVVDDCYIPGMKGERPRE